MGGFTYEVALFWVSSFQKDPTYLILNMIESSNSNQMR